MRRLKPINLLIFLALLGICTSMRAQIFIDQTSEWTYKEYYYPISQTTYIRAVKDTLIQGRPFVRIEGQCSSDIKTPKYLSGGDNRMYWYDMATDSIRLLYDFNKQVGETWTMDLGMSLKDHSTEPLTIQFKVDSISYHPTNNVTLQVQHVSFDPNLGYWLEPKIYEMLGSESCLIPTCALCPPGTGPLTCYSNEQFGLINLRDSLPCNVAVNVQSTISKSIKIFPSPGLDYINIELGKDEKMEQVEIFNMNGFRMMVFGPDQGDLPLDVSSLSTGIYVLKVSSNKNFYATKWVKQ